MKHATEWGYVTGCRCPDCTIAGDPLSAPDHTPREPNLPGLRWSGAPSGDGRRNATADDLLSLRADGPPPTPLTRVAA